MTLQYPQNITKQDYIQQVLSYLNPYNEDRFVTKQLEAFVDEIITRTVNIIESKTKDENQNSKMMELLSLLNYQEPQFETFEQNNEYNSDSDEDYSPLTPIEELLLYVTGDKSQIYLDIRNKGIILDPNQDLNSLRALISKAAKKCIEEICKANLPALTKVPSLAPVEPTIFLGKLTNRSS